MDYAKHYSKLIARAQTRELSGYNERHHILPKCLGGADTPDNLVRLTAEEHFVAHQLLVKMHPGNGKLAFAAQMMCVNGTHTHRSNKLYGWLRKRLSERTFTPEHRANLSIALKGKKRGPISEEHKAKISAGSKGHIRSEQSRKNLSRGQMGNQKGLGTKRTPEQKARMKAGQLKHYAAKRLNNQKESS